MILKISGTFLYTFDVCRGCKPREAPSYNGRDTTAPYGLLCAAH
nr:MAG TPA: hypothetical protein [Caudoviricetes sp.]